MAKDRFYVAVDDHRQLLVIGWNLPHEPTEDNECGYRIDAGPFDTKVEAQQYINEGK